MQQYGGGAADPFRSLSGLPNASPIAQAPAGQQQPLADGGVARSSAVEAPSENGRDIMKLQASLERTLSKYNEDVLRVLEAVTLRLERLEVAQDRAEKTAAALKTSVDVAVRDANERAGEFETTLNGAAEAVQALRDKQTLLEEQQRLADSTLAEARAELSRVKDISREVAKEVVREVQEQQQQAAAEKAAAATQQAAPEGDSHAPLPVEAPSPVPDAPQPHMMPLPAYAAPPAPGGPFGGPPPAAASTYGFPGGLPAPAYAPYAPPLGYPPSPHGETPHAHPGAPPPMPQMILSPPPAMDSYGGYSAPPPPPPPPVHGHHGGYGYAPPPPPPPPMRGGPAPPPAQLSTSKVPVDKVIDDLAAMGFTRDEVRGVIRSLTENGQSVDLNVVIDRLMNGAGGADAAARGRAWFGR